ncbi:MAG TPA: sigma-70 family RNA polymerase sigma factor [Candidatus Methylomirabilis sp.]|nr:sigma-70 family RNA polymerase sigma factor [Candidatus Methylomirabilis sp.]
MDLESAVRAAATGDLEAFAEITRRTQHMAFGYALSFVGDLGLAEDVVQEAFVAAWYGLPTLIEAAAFPGWLRGIVRHIVRHQAHRVLRRRHLQAVPLADAGTVAADTPGADRVVERRQEARALLTAIAGLSRPLREVVTLFYVHECSQQDIATFLGIPVTTVNNRLHAGRTQLRRRTLAMVKDTLHAHQLPDDFAARIGRIVRAREGIIDARFDPTNLPDILTELVVSDEARQHPVTLQVVQRLPDGIVRCVVTSPAGGLSPGLTVLNAGRRVESPISHETFDRSVRSLAGPPSPPGARLELLETGIKVIDVMCPLVRGGTVAIAGEPRAGTLVVLEELVRRLSGGPEGVSFFTIAPWWPESIAEALRKEGYSEGTVGSVQTFYFRAEEGAWTPERLASLGAVDVVIRLSVDLARRGTYPTVDPLMSRSRLLDAGAVDPAHAELAARIREALRPLLTSAHEAASAYEGRAAERAVKLLRFFAQPFFVAEPYTRRPGATVRLAESLRVCREILDGVHDAVPSEAFYFTGGLDAVLARAASG